MIRHSRLAAFAIVTALCATRPSDAVAQPPRLEYRVVHAAPYQLQQVIDAAGRDGFTCVSVARPELDVKLTGVVVTLARQYYEMTHVHQTVRQRVVRGSGSGGDFGELLEKNAAESYKLCGVTLTDASPGPVLVGVMVPDTDRPPAGRHYAATVTGSADRVAQLAALGEKGFVPVAATAINDNRVPEQRHWLVVTEQTTTAPVGIVVRARPGPDALAKAIAEQSAQGFICSLLWKEGLTSLVVVMSKLPADPTRRPEFRVDTIDPARINNMSGVYIGDVPYLSDGQRVIVTINDRSATTYTASEPLPPLGARDMASVGDLQPLGEHLGGNRVRDRSRVVASTVRRNPKGEPVLHTVFVQFGR